MLIQEQLKAQSSSSRITGFDFVRALSCCFVVAFHISPFPSNSPTSKFFGVLVFGSAVPIFIIISLFLTNLKGCETSYVYQKIGRLAKLYFIWGWLIPIVLFLLQFSPIQELSGSQFLNFYQLVVNGFNIKYEVAPIYFLTYLMALTWIYYQLKSKMATYKAVYISFVLLAAFNLIIPLLPSQFEAFRDTVHPFGFLSFLIYIPLSKLLYMDFSNGKNQAKRAVAWFIGFLVFGAEEGFLEIADGRYGGLPEFHHSPYGRLSVAFLAMAFLYCAFLVKASTKVASFWTVDLIAKCSLGIYLTHILIRSVLDKAHLLLPAPWSFLVVLCLSTVLTCIIHDLPLLKKTIVL
jgi:peptidoglycan/LPS O-acetylase OafA/YrhL